MRSQRSAISISSNPREMPYTDAGVELCDDPSRIDLVISSYDRTFDYRKLQIAFDALWFHRRARLVATLNRAASREWA